MSHESKIYGLLAEFTDPEHLVLATREAYEAGYRRMDAYTPFPVEGLSAALGRTRTRLPIVALVGGICGLIGAYAMQYYACVIAYPLNVGGRPLHSWASFIPITFELTVLGAALFSVLGILALNGLPMPYHPLFNVPEFKLASRDRFFLCIEASDPVFSPSATRRYLESLRPARVYEVPT